MSQSQKCKYGKDLHVKPAKEGAENQRTDCSEDIKIDKEKIDESKDLPNVDELVARYVGSLALVTL